MPIENPYKYVMMNSKEKENTGKLPERRKSTYKGKITKLIWLPVDSIKYRNTIKYFIQGSEENIFIKDFSFKLSNIQEWGEDKTFRIKEDNKVTFHRLS